MARFGCLLILLAVVALMATIVIPVLPFFEDNESIDTAMQPLLCQPGERVIREQYTTTDSDGTGYSMNVYCMGRDEVRQDVTWRWVLIGVVGFVLPLLGGLRLITVAAARTAQQSGATMVSLGVSAEAPAPGVTAHQSPAADPDQSLTERLEELEQARSLGLITEAEYTRMRKAVLDEGV
jgi:hypothetical protein